MAINVKHYSVLGGLMSIAIFFSLSLPFLFTNASDTESTQGTVFRCGLAQEVYYLHFDGKRYLIPDGKTAASHPGLPETKNLAATACAQNELSPVVVTVRPGDKLVKFPYEDKIYAVAFPNILRPLASTDIAETLYGPGWDDKSRKGGLRVLQGEYKGDYVIGSPIFSAGNYNKEDEMRMSAGFPAFLSALANR